MIFERVRKNAHFIQPFAVDADVLGVDVKNSVGEFAQRADGYLWTRPLVSSLRTWLWL